MPSDNKIFKANEAALRGITNIEENWGVIFRDMVESHTLENEMGLDTGPTEEVEEVIGSYNGEPSYLEKRRILSLIVNRSRCFNMWMG